MADRTPEERERARLERAAKRAARDGKPPPTELPSLEIPPPVFDADASPAPEPEEEFEPAPPPPAPEPEEPVPPPPPEPEEPFEPIQPSLTRESERQPTEELEAPVEPEPAPEPVISQPLAEPEPVPPPEPEPEPIPEPEPLAETVPEPAPDPVPERVMPPPEPANVVEPKSRADAAREILDRHKAQKKPRRRTGRRRVGIGITLGALGLVVLAVAWFAFALFQPFKGDGDGRVPVRIPTGASVGQIADLLEQRGVISSAFFFEARATVAGRRDDFKAGQFQLKRDMSSTAAMDAISKGPPANVTQVVIPEGRARTQVRDIIGKRLPGNYLEASRKSNALDPRRYGAPRTVSSLEGFLFPDSYELKKGSTVTTLVNQQLAQFKRRFRGVDLAGAKRRKLNAYDVLTIASMIDQEAQLPRERRVIASVIMNRLREGIPLGIDATIRYATNNRTSPLKESEINSSSPYNTRSRRGLPPGPIGSPGLAAIRAAANPANTKFLYYVVKPNTCGEHAFSETNAEFERNVQRYNTARARRGGKSPTKC